MRGNRLGLTLIRGFGRADAPRGRIALSLVHPRGRIDVPVSAIRRIEAHAEQTFFEQETGQPVAYSSRPHVEVYVSPAIRARMWWLTRQITDEPLEIIVDGECVSAPIVREPLGGPSFHISASDFAEAQALAERLRVGWSKPGPRAVE